MWRSGLIVAGSIAIAAPQQIEGQPPARTSVDCESPGPKPARRELPAQTEYWKAKLVERSDGLRVWVGAQGEEFINVGVFGETLMVINPGDSLSLRQQASIAWLEQHKESLSKEALVWRSNYATNYNDQMFTPPWSGGYGQASIIAGFLALHAANQEPKWLDLALRAGLAFGVPTVDGGFCERLPNGSLWFEELTSPEAAKAGRSTHIINGHIWATLQLVRLAKATGDARISRLASEGQRALKASIGLFDNGTWIRYDLSPRRYDLRFCLSYRPTEAPSVEGPFVGPCITKIELAHADARYRPVELCIGVAEDDAGAWRLGDGKWGAEFGVVPWGGREVVGDRQCRRLQSGKSVFVLELPAGAETDYFREPFLMLKVWYIDCAAGKGALDAMVFSMREQVNNEYAELPGSRQELLGDGQVRCLEKSVRICDLGKSSLTAWKIVNAYIKPLRQLGELTGDPFFAEWADRLAKQVDALKASYPALKFGDR